MLHVARDGVGLSSAPFANETGKLRGVEDGHATTIGPCLLVNEFQIATGTEGPETFNAIAIAVSSPPQHTEELVSGVLTRVWASWPSAENRAKGAKDGEDG